MRSRKRRDLSCILKRSGAAAFRDTSESKGSAPGGGFAF